MSMMTQAICVPRTTAAPWAIIISRVTPNVVSMP